jgi:2,3-bisphosphoglycerate-independent phosphoglycerate mutase
MKTREITDYLLKNFKKYDFCVANFCNGDMVGHTGNLRAAIKGVEVVDECLGKIINKIKDRDILITADHGNCEEIKGKWETSHTLNKVPFVLVGEKKLKNGNLGDVAPPVLKLMGIKKPKEMKGRSLIIL